MSFKQFSSLGLGIAAIMGFFVWPPGFALAIDAPALTLTSTCGGVAGDGSSAPQDMQGPGGPFIHLSWNSVADASQYQVYRKVGAGSWESFGGPLPAFVTSLRDPLVDSLSTSYPEGGTLHYYVEAVSSSGETADSTSQEIEIPRCIPFLMAYPVCGSNRGFHLNFTATKDITFHNIYRLKEGEPEANLIDQFSYPADFENRWPGRFYYIDGVIEETAASREYWIDAAGEGGQHFLSNEVVTEALDCTNPPSAPTVKEMDPWCESNTDSRIYLEWEPSNNAAGYTVWRREEGDSGAGNPVGNTDPEVNWFNDNTEGSEGTEFEYRIEATNTSGDNAFSPWEPGTDITDPNPLTAPLCGTPSPKPDFVPPAPDANCAGGLGVDLEWVESVGAEEYHIFRQGPGDTSLILYKKFVQGVHAEFGTRTFRDEDVVSQETYFYKIEAHGLAGTTPSESTTESVLTPDCSPPGSFSINEPLVLECAGPIIEARSSGDTGISWTASTNATSYDLFRKKDSDGSVVTHSGVSSPYLDSGFADAVSAAIEKYSWQAEAKGPGGTKLSVETALYNAPICEPGKPAVTLTPVCEPGVGSAMLVEWTYALNTVSYEISRDGMPVAQFDRGVDAEFDSRSWTDTGGGGGLAPLVSYAYTVKAIGPTGLEKISDPASEIASDCSPPTIPQNVTAEFVCIGVGDTSPPRARVRWDDSDNATSYDVWRDNDDDGVPDVVVASVSDDGSPTYEILDPIAVNTKYTYYIKAIGPGGESDFSVAAVVDPATHVNSNYCKPPAPTITTLATTCTGGNPVNMLSWTAESTPNNTASYEIYRSEVDSIPGTPLASGITSTTWTDTTLTSPGDISTTFYYWVKAVGAGPTTLKSDASASKSIQTLACGVEPDPPVVSVTNNQCVAGRPEITLDWADTANAVSYDVYRDGALTYQNRWHPFKDNGSHALEFDGGDDAVKVANSPTIDELSAFTIALWIYSDTGSGRLAEKQDGVGNDEWRWFLNGPNSLRFTYTPNGGDWDISIGGGFSFLDTWHHVVLTYDNSSPDNDPVMYVDGVPRAVNETAAPGALTVGQDDPLFIGGRSSGLNAFDGKLDDVRMYKRVLSADEADNLHDGNAVSPYGLVGMWHFDDATGTTAKDDSGNGNNGTLQNGPAWVQLQGIDPTHESEPLDSSAPYAYKVRALGVDTNSPSSDSNTVSETTLDCRPSNQEPDVDLACDAETVSVAIALSWLIDENTQYWDLYRKKTSDSTWGAPIASSIPNTTTSYEDKGVEAGEEYHYFLEGIGYQGESSCDSDPGGCKVSVSIVADQGEACDEVPPPKPEWTDGTLFFCDGDAPRMRLEWTSAHPLSGTTYNLSRTGHSAKSWTDVGEVGLKTMEDGSIIWVRFFTDTELGTPPLHAQFDYTVTAVRGGDSVASDSKTLEVQEDCAALPPTGFNAFIGTDITSRGDLRAIPLEWTSAQTEHYYRVYRTDGFATEEEARAAKDNNEFTLVPIDHDDNDDKLDRGTPGNDYASGLSPAPNCDDEDNFPCIHGEDRETSTGLSPVTTPRMEDELYYYYRVVAFKGVSDSSCGLPFTTDSDVECVGADAGVVLLPVAQPGLFDLSSDITDDDPPNIELIWTQPLYTTKGGPPTYSVERSRSFDPMIKRLINPQPIGDCTNIGVLECTEPGQRGITHYQVKATNNAEDEFGNKRPTFSNIVQAGLYLFPEELREISPF